MKLVAAGIALLLLGSASVEAGLFSRNNKFPKPIDSPIVRPKYQDSHKAGKRVGRHASAFYKPEWGADWGRTLTMRRHHPIPEYLYQTQ